MIPTDLHGRVMWMNATVADTVQAVDRDGIGLGSHRVRGLNGSVLRVLSVERIPLDFHEERPPPPPPPPDVAHVARWADPHLRSNHE